MPARRSIPESVQHQVRERADYLCEYCHTAEQWQYVRFTIDHLLAVVQGGTNDLANLALACFHCNRRKSTLLTTIDPDTGETVPLFNPRQQAWANHFVWSSDRLRIVALTPIGRATIERLHLNRTRVLDIRAADLTVGRHPPPTDPVMQSNLWAE
jgi:5-methylcytosine-specific restriction endonuclease McrA